MTARVAVVIPSYNHERFLPEAIDSVLAQTRAADRFLIVDDGSADRSPELVEGYADRGVELFVQPNAGAHAALNRAVSTVARDCEVIAILNSDDAYESERLERCVDRLEAEPGAGVVCTGLQVVDDEGKPLPEDSARRRWFDVAWSAGAAGDLEPAAWLALANFPATTSNIVARREDLLRDPFRAYRYCHDYAFLVGVALRGRLELIEAPLLRYRVHGGNTMVMDPAPLVRELLRMHLDLQRALAPELLRDEALRARFCAFERALWDNASSLDAGLSSVVRAELVRRTPASDLDAVLAELETLALAELTRVPNAAIQKEDLEIGREVPRSEYAARNAALRELLAKQARLDAGLLGSRWLALGQLLGLAGDVLPRGKRGGRDEASPARELASLKRRVRGSRWLRLGAQLGIASARRVRALAEDDA